MKSKLLKISNTILFISMIILCASDNLPSQNSQPSKNRTDVYEKTTIVNKVNQPDDTDEKTIETETLPAGEKGLTAILSGRGKTFISDTKVTVFQKNRKKYSFKVPEGYSPKITFYEFAENENLLFYSAQSGGSGGYGYYLVYRLTDNGSEVVYSWEDDSRSNRYSAEFTDGSILTLHSINQKSKLSINAEYMDTDYYSRIFDGSGKVKAGMSGANVNPISAVFPCFNSALNVCQLITYRSVTAVAEVNRLGYITQSLLYDGQKFIPVMTDFLISIN